MIRLVFMYYNIANNEEEGRKKP